MQLWITLDTEYPVYINLEYKKIDKNQRGDIVFSPYSPLYNPKDIKKFDI